MFSCQNESDAIAPQNTVELKQLIEPVIGTDDYIIGKLQKLGGGAFKCRDTDGVCIIIPPNKLRTQVVEVISSDATGTTYRILNEEQVIFPSKE